MEAGFDAFEEAGGDQGRDRGLDVGGAEALAARLEIGFCQTVVSGQEDGSENSRLTLAISPACHAFEPSKGYERVFVFRPCRGRR